MLRLVLVIADGVQRYRSGSTTVRQVATLLGVCRATVYKWATIGVLPHVRIVKLVRFRYADLALCLKGRSSSRLR